MIDKHDQGKMLVSIEEAAREVEKAITRLALLHLSFSKTLVNELGENKGKEIIIKSILEYGKRVGERIKKGLPDLPKYGIYAYYDQEKFYGCVLAKIFQEHDEEDLGCLYCYVDAAKSMQVDPNYKFIHKTCAACGDENCTFERVSTTEKDRKSFQNMEKDWRLVDKRLAEGVTPKKTNQNKRRTKT
jgi:hypothetical protein